MMNQKSDTVTVGLIQMRCSSDPANNLHRAIEKIQEAVHRGAEIVCLPELFLTRYFCKEEDSSHFALAEPIPGPTTSRLSSVAADHGITLIASLFEKRAEGLYHNTVAVIDGKNGYIGKYRKMHIPDDPLFYEKFYFTPGDLGFKVFDTDHGKVGTLICWDQWYPEAARLTAMQGANILFYPTAIGWLPEEKPLRGDAQHEAWEIAQRAHAIANGCYVVAVNRVGYEPLHESSSDQDSGIIFWGQSFIASPDGSIMIRGPVDEEETLIVTLDMSRVGAFRNEWPFFRDRRIDAYSGITRRFLDE